MRKNLFIVAILAVLLFQTSCENNDTLEAVEIDVVNDELSVGDTLKLTYSYVPSSLPTAPIATWSSSNSLVAEVDKTTGVLYAKGVGNVTINLLLKHGDKEVSCEKNFEIKEVFAQEFYFTEKDLEIKVGDSHKLECVIIPNNVTNKNVSYLSSDIKIATVTNKGEVLGVFPGETEITARIFGTTAYTACRVKVVPVLAEKIKINKDRLEIKVGSMDSLFVGFVPENTTDKSVVWSTSNDNIVTVSKDGVVSALSVGTCNISASTKDGTISDQCEVVVKPIEVSGIVLVESEKTVIAGGDDFDLEYIISPSNATNKNVKIISDNENVVEVLSNGKLRAKNVGSANVTIITIDGGYSATATIKVISYTDWVKTYVPSMIELRTSGSQMNIGGYLTFNGYVVVRNEADKKIKVTGLSFYETSNASLKMIGAYYPNRVIYSGSYEYFGGYKFNNVYEPYVKIEFTYDGISLSLLKKISDL